jgi:hypothetical protein
MKTKINLTFFKKMLLKCKYIILGVLVLIIIFYFSFSREGMTSSSDCDYKYLDPASKSGDGYNTWPENVKRNFWVKMYPILPGGDPDASKDFNSLTSYDQNSYINLSHPRIGNGMFHDSLPDMHLEEAKYFIERGEFPLCLFVKNTVSKMQEMGRARDAAEGRGRSNYGDFKLPKFYWNRVAFAGLGDPETDKKAYSIFMGTMKQPCSSSSSSSSSPSSSYSPPSSSSPQGSLTGSSYKQLISICKSIMPK